MKDSQRIYRLGIRRQLFNRLTIPVLLHQLESSGLDDELEIEIVQNTSQLRTFIVDSHPGLLLYSFMTPNLPVISKEINQIFKNR
jgi:hypothetical protein